MPGAGSGHEHPVLFDVAVIGRGLIGSAAARHLAEAGQRVVVVGPDEPADWSSWTGPFASHFDEGRITRVSDRDPVWSEVARRSIERYPDIEARSGIAFHHPVGLAISTTDLDTWLDTSRANGAAVDAVDADRMAETTGIALPAGARGAYESGPAGFINPRRLVTAQTTLARRAGASIVAEAATSLRGRAGPDADSGPGLEIAGPWGSVRAERVVLATGSFGHHLVGHGLDVVRRPRTVLLAELAPDPDRSRHLPSLILRDPADRRLSSVYWVPPVAYPDGRTMLKIGGVLQPDPVIGRGPDPDAEMVAWFHGAGDPVEADALRVSLEALLPERPLGATTTVPCVYTGTPTGYPYLDWFDDGVVVAIGGNGAAAKSSDELGRLAAALVSEGAIGAPPDPAVFAKVSARV